MPETPQRVSQKFRQVIDRLNSTWNLQLPQLPRADASQFLHDHKTLTRRCSSRIEFLCHRSDDEVESAITEFEEEAKIIFSRWVWKPSQERGTIPSVPTGESLLRRDIMSGMCGPTSARFRECLLQKLSAILDDEYKLTQESDNYQRTSSQSFITRRSSRKSSGDAATERNKMSFPSQASKEERRFPNLDSASNKRCHSSSQQKDEKRQKIFEGARERHNRNAQVKDYFLISKDAVQSRSQQVKLPLSFSNDIVDPATNRTTQQNITQNEMTSFNTSMSPVASVFTDDPGDVPNFSQATSFMDDEGEPSQDLFPTQDATEYLKDESFRSEFDAANATSTSFCFENLDAASPFQKTQRLPSNMIYWIRWELYRVAQCTGLQPMWLYNSLGSPQNNVSYNQFWKDLGTLCRSHGKVLPAKSDVKSWMKGTSAYNSPDGNTCYFTFTLEYEREPGPRLWKMILNPIKTEQGNRIHRKYGADRHLMGYLNFFDKSSLPRWVCQKRNFDAEDSFQKLAAWLATQTHHIAGRQWRSFYLEPEKKKTRRQTGEAPRLKLNFFAVDGDDFDVMPNVSQCSTTYKPMPIRDFIDWHIPLAENLNSTDLKIFSRFGLGLSKTKSTITLEPHQFRYVPIKQEPDMEDGCSLMSWGMARAIWEMCGDGSQNVPSAFQGRIGGAKGLWIVDYRSNDGPRSDEPRWIEVSESQLKIQPQPQQRLDADETQRIFEVLKWSSPCLPGHLNMQLINILADRGVSRSTLRQIILNDIEEYIQASRGAMRDGRLLLGWLQDYHSGGRREHPPDFDDGLPKGKEESVLYLALCGFTAENCEFLRNELVSLVRQRLDTYVDKLRIELPYSTSTFCVPDPYKILEEGEVHLGFSEHWVNPRTGFKEFALNDVDVLVSRNPAALASDIQKVKAVYKHDLRHFKDVIVFSTKGDAPLASLLSGGDYDGDIVTVIWDPSLVDNFFPVQKPVLPTEEQCGLQKVSKSLNETITSLPASDFDIDKFMTDCVAFNAQPNRLGVCTNEHEKLIYSGVKLSEPGSVTLAALCGYLVDANKQGLFQDEKSWQDIRRKTQGGRKLYPLAYRNGEDLPRRFDNGECINVMDYLKFDVAMNRKQEILAEFEKMLPDAWNYDIELSRPYNDELDKCTDRNDGERDHRAATMSDLKKRLTVIIEEWSKISGRRDVSNDQSDVASSIRIISSLIQELSPIKSDCDIYRDYISDSQGRGLSAKGSRWSLLRASALYKLHSRSKITFWTVGDELGRIKARAGGITIESRPEMHHLLKPDSKYIKRLTGETLIEDESDNER